MLGFSHLLLVGGLALSYLGANMSIARLAGSAFTGLAKNIGVMGLVGGGIDYAAGKMAGEDDARALAGAVGATLLGGVGAAAGAKALGAVAANKFLPVAGSLAGGYTAGTLGGYLADRGDDVIRGEQKVSQVVLPVDLEDTSDIAKAAGQLGLHKQAGRLAGILGR